MSIKIEDLTISDISTEISQTDVDISLIPAMWNDLNKLKQADSSLLSDALFNTKAGTEALNSLTTGNKNSAFGYYSLYSNTTGYNNSAVGYKALYSNTEGLSNTALGLQSLLANTTGDDNTAIGLSSLQSNTTGDDNTAIGRGSLVFNTTGSSNTAVGHRALYNNTTGSSNIGIGVASGWYTSSLAENQTSASSIYIGCSTKSNADGDTNEIVIGSTAIGQGSNTIMLGNSSITGLYCYDTSIASPSDRRVKENITDIGDSKLLEFIEKLEPITYNKKNQCDWDDKIKLNDYKDNKIKKAEKRPKTNDRTYAGLIAQDVEKAMKDTGVNYELVNTASNGMKTLRYGDLIPALIGAVKELKKELDELRKTK